MCGSRRSMHASPTLQPTRRDSRLSNARFRARADTWVTIRGPHYRSLLMKQVLIGSAAALFLLPAMASAQSANPLSAAAKAHYDMVKVNLPKRAARVPEDLYAFKPTPEVRSLGQLIGHVADANFAICSAAAGEKPPQGGFEKKTSKAELTKGLTD